LERMLGTYLGGSARAERIGGHRETKKQGLRGDQGNFGQNSRRREDKYFYKGQHSKAEGKIKRKGRKKKSSRGATRPISRK